MAATREVQQMAPVGSWRPHVQRCGPTNPDCGCDPLERALVAQRAPQTSASAVASAAHGLVGLQRRAGNAAVTALLADRDRAPVAQRAAAGDAPSYNAARGYDDDAARVVATHVASPTSAPDSPEFATAVASWQGAPVRGLQADGKVGPRSLGVVADELAGAGADEAAAALDRYPQKGRGGTGVAAGGAQDEAAVDSCTGTPKHGPGEVHEPLDGPTHKRVELVNFDIGKSFLKAEHRAFLRKRFTAPATTALFDDGWTMFVSGHASTTGSADYNLLLGRLRAVCTRLFLLDVGVPAGAAAHDSSGEAVARAKLIAAGAPRTDDVESAPDRRVQIDLVKTVGPGPEPPADDETCPTAEEFDEAMCEEGRWQAVFDYCSQRLVTDHLAMDAACQALGPTECAMVWLGLIPFDELSPVAKTCCTPSGGPDAETLGEQLVECSVREMAAIAEAHDWFPDCPELTTPERLRDSFERCLPSVVPAG